MPGEIVHLTLDRPVEGTSLSVPLVLGPLQPEARQDQALAQRIALQVIASFPVVFLLVGLVVLFLRLPDRNAWLLALLFACFIATAPMLDGESVVHPALRGFSVAYKVVFNGLFGALLYYFCAVFPVPSPIDRRWPWLKRLLLAATLAVVVPIGLAVLAAGGSRPLVRLGAWAGPAAVTAVLSSYFFGATALALVSLIWNGLGAPTPEARRRTRVVVWGTIGGVTPFMLLEAASLVSGRDPYEFPFWVWAPCVLAVLLLPLSFAYAVVKYRVLEIPLLLKRGARYLLVQRGFTILLVCAIAGLTLLFAAWAPALLEGRLGIGAGSGVSLGAAFGILLVWAGARVSRRVTQRIDRAFFRGAYDARQILHALAEKTSAAANRDELGAFLADHIRRALHPRSLSIFLLARDGSLHVARGDQASGYPAAVPGPDPPPRDLPDTIPADHPGLAELARLGRPFLVPPPGIGGPARLSLAGLPPAECLVPFVGRGAQLVGVLLLGERLSEETYSGEDRRLLSAVAGQAALALQNIRLAEQIAERLEAERRTAVELELAREVQSRLLPRTAPPLRTLDCAGDCAQARSVGGDFYDFLDLGGGQTALVLADIAGKGMAGALTMASLQAHLRAHSGQAREDLVRLLRGLNASLCESLAAGRFATLVLGCYDDTTRRLRYANCGHNPPLLLRADGRVERLAATATILGAFTTWDCAVAEVLLDPGDTLLLYSDGITEATDGGGEEFGEARLLEAVRRHRADGAPALIAGILAAVRGFHRGEQADDMTLVAARCR
jgi:serine phosphatase RsbU (regulator of sigma subunit)